MTFLCVMSITTFVLTALMISGRIGNRCNCSDAAEGTLQRQVSESPDSQAQSSNPPINGIVDTDIETINGVLQENMTKLQEAVEVRATELENIWEALRILESVCRNLTIQLKNVSEVQEQIGNNCC